MVTNDRGGGQPAGILQSGTPRLSPAAPAADVAALVAGNAAFASDLFRGGGASPSENTLVASYSISLALAMTYAGAAGNTAQQMSAVLHFDLPPDRLHAAFNALDRQLLRGNDRSSYRLNLVNSLWAADDLTVRPAFLDRLSAHYGAGLRTVDFAGSPVRSREAINRWVEEETSHKIRQLLSAGDVQADTRLVLVNAIYLKALWQQKFNPERTKDGLFTRTDGSRVTVPFMAQSGPFDYAAGSGYQALQLHYLSPLSLLLILPDRGQEAAVERELGPSLLGEIDGALSKRSVSMRLPRFSFEASFRLSQVLRRMGMVDAFTGAADFSGITSEPLCIGEVIHKCIVDVDEEGTEAAGATAAVLLRSLPPQAEGGPVVIDFDRPFYFMLRDYSSGAVLFLGRVANPAHALP